MILIASISIRHSRSSFSTTIMLRTAAKTLAAEIASHLSLQETSSAMSRHPHRSPQDLHWSRYGLSSGESRLT
jgi:hypothetical protein